MKNIVPPGYEIVLDLNSFEELGLKLAFLGKEYVDIYHDYTDDIYNNDYLIIGITVYTFKVRNEDFLLLTFVRRDEPQIVYGVIYPKEYDLYKFFIPREECEKYLNSIEWIDENQ